MDATEDETVNAQYRAGYRQGEADWRDGAVNIQTLQDWTEFGQGYRAARRDLRAKEAGPGGRA